MLVNKITLGSLIGLSLACFICANIQADDIESRKAKIEQMTAAEKDELRGKQKRFESLSSTEQEKYRVLHSTIEQHPDGDRLKSVMQSYYEWLKSLDAVKRAELQALEPAERIAHIKQIMQQQERQRFHELAADAASNVKPEDIRVIKEWMMAFIETNKSAILASQPDLSKGPGFFRDQMDRVPDERKAAFFWFWTVRYQPQKAIFPEKEDFVSLIGQLQPETQKHLTKLPEDKRQAVMRGWIMAAVFSSRGPKVSEEELQEFYKHLPPEQQSQLASLPPEEFERRLRSEYMKRTFMGGRGPGGRGPGGRGGPNGRGGPFFDSGRPPGGGPGGPGGGKRPPRNNGGGPGKQKQSDRKPPEQSS